MLRRLGRLLRGRAGLVAAPAGTPLAALALGACDQGAAVPGAELLVSLVETAETLRAAALFYDAGVTAFPDYYGIVGEGTKCQRMMTFAGAAMVTLALLIQMRATGVGFMTRFDGELSFAPVAATGAFDVAWFEAAFIAIAGFFPCIHLDADEDAAHSRDRGHIRSRMWPRMRRAAHPYRPADLAEGFEHLRAFAYSSVALRAAALEVPGSRIGETEVSALGAQGPGKARRLMSQRGDDVDAMANQHRAKAMSAHRAVAGVCDPGAPKGELGLSQLLTSAWT